MRNSTNAQNATLLRAQGKFRAVKLVERRRLKISKNQIKKDKKRR